MSSALGVLFSKREGQFVVVSSVILVLLTLWGFTPARAAAPVTVRVALVQGVPTVTWGVEAGRYALVDLAAGVEIGEAVPGEEWQIARQGAGLVVYRHGELLEGTYQGPLEARPVAGDPPLFRLGDTICRGSLQVRGQAEGLIAVNILGVEEYLYGVVGSEIGYDAPMEVLKAQAVAARSYVLASLAPARHYDVGRGTTNQVYGGYRAETERVREAVDATAGQVIYCQGRLVQAFYHANAGGHTENSENVWQENLPYLRAVPSPWDTAALDYTPRAANGWPANTYQWEVRYSRSELEEKIAAWNAAQLVAGKPENVVDVGQLTGLIVSRTARDGSSSTPSGRVTRLEVVGEAGTHILERENARLFLDLRSTLFDLETDAQLSILSPAGSPQLYQTGKGLAALGAGNIPVEVNAAGDTYWVLGAGGKFREMPKVLQEVNITGRGYGHGVGMSQWGARGMAAAGYNYQEIIAYYYNQAQVSAYRAQ